jgi:Rod binding domain-containing protein
MRIETTFQQGGTDRSTASLRKHATEFEGILLTEMLGKLQHTFAQSESDGAGDSASDTISSMGTQALAQALAQRNVLGIGNMVAHALTRDTTEVTGESVNSELPLADEASRSTK